MNDLDLIRDLGPLLDPEPTTPPARMRVRFIAAITHPRRPADAARRVPLLVAATAATAAIIAFASTQIATPTPADTRPDTATGARPETERTDTAPPDTSADTELDGRQILLAAASSARSQRAEAPDPDAYIYTQLKQREWWWETGASTSRMELWWPVDGTGGALDTFSDAEGGGTSLRCLPDEDARYSRYMRPNPTAEHIAACEADPGYVTGLPHDPDTMLTYLMDHPGPAEPGDAEFATVFTNAWQLLMWRQVEPRARATIFEALAGLAQLDVRPDAETVDGETGTAVVYSPARRERFELIFDGETFELIGSRQIWLRRKKATNTWVDGWTAESAVVDQAVVPEMRQRPDGTRHTDKIDFLVHNELSGRPEFED